MEDIWDDHQVMPEVFKIVLSDEASVLEKLIEEDKKVLETSYKSKTLLGFAIEKCADKCVDIIIPKVNCNERIDYQDHPLEEAIKVNNKYIVQKLLEGRDLISDEKLQKTEALQTIFDEDNVDILEVVCEKYEQLRSNSAVHGVHQVSTLALAFELNATRCIDYLLAQKPPLISLMEEIPTQIIFYTHGWSCVFSSAINNLDYVSVEKILKRKNSDKYLEIILNTGKKFIHAAAERTTFAAGEPFQKAKIMKALLQKQKNPDTLDIYGNTALHYATDIATAKTLLGAGLKATTKNNDGKLPGEVTYYQEVAEWLEEIRNKSDNF